MEALQRAYAQLDKAGAHSGPMAAERAGDLMAEQVRSAAEHIASENALNFGAAQAELGIGRAGRERV